MNKILKYIALVGIFIVPFVPLIITNSLFFPFITGKNFVFRLVVEIVFAAWLVLAVTDTEYRPRRSWILYLFAAFVGVMAVADIFSVNPAKSFWSNYERMEGWVTLAHLLAYFIAAGAILAKERLWDAFFQTSLGVNTVIIVYSLLQINHLVVINQGGVRVDATLGNAAYLAIYAVFHIFIALMYLVWTNENTRTHKNGFLALGFNAGFFAFAFPILQMIASQSSESSASNALIWGFIAWICINLLFYVTVMFRQERIVYGALVLSNLAILYFTATRGAMLGFIGGLLLAALLIAWREKENKLVRKISYGIIVAVVVVVVGFLAIRSTNFVRQSPILNRFATISTSETTTLSRFKLWNMAFQGFKERPIFGWGQESFNYVFNAKYNPELYAQEQWFDRTHNVILDWVIAGGILGVAAYLAFFGSIFYFLWRGRGRHSFSDTERALITGLLAAYFIHNLFVFDNIVSYIMFISIGAYVYFKTSARVESVHHANRIILPVVAIGLVLLVYAVNARPFFASQVLIHALSAPAQPGDVTDKVGLFKKALAYNSYGNQEIREQLISVSSQVAAAVSQQQQVKGASELIALAASEAKNQMAETPNDARAYVISAGFYAQAGAVKEALEALKKAHELSPTKQSISFALGSTYLMVSDFEKAYAIYKEAFELEPSYLAARLYYATAAIYNNKLAEADKVLEGVATSTVAQSNDIVSAYYTTKQYGRLLALWKQRVKDDPSAQNHVSLAAAYLLVNDRKGAVAEIREAIRLEPSFKTQGEDYIKQIQAGKNPS